MKKSKRIKEMNDSVIAMQGVKVSNKPYVMEEPVPCHIYTRSGKLASYMLIVDGSEVKIMSKKKVKSSIPIDQCHAKIVPKV